MPRASSGIVAMLVPTSLRLAVVLSGCDEILRVAGSPPIRFCYDLPLHLRVTSPSSAEYADRVLQEYGKFEKTIFILRYIQGLDFRLIINLQLNKGEQLHSLRQFIICQ